MQGFTGCPIVIDQLGLVFRVRLSVGRDAFHDANGLDDELDDRRRVLHRLHDRDVGRVQRVQSVDGGLNKNCFSG